MVPLRVFYGPFIHYLPSVGRKIITWSTMQDKHLAQLAAREIMHVLFDR